MTTLSKTACSLTAGLNARTRDVVGVAKQSLSGLSLRVKGANRKPQNMSPGGNGQHSENFMSGRKTQGEASPINDATGVTSLMCKVEFLAALTTF